jgi:curved DNA-binding protein CbpA
MKNYYDILDLSNDAEPEKIRKQYRLLVISCHPDKFTDPGEKARAEERIKDINEAYEVLKDPVRRARYDRRRDPQSVPFSSHARSRPEPRPNRSRRVRGDEPKHLHYEFHGLRGDQLEVGIDRKANVILLDEANYQRYQIDRPFRYVGGYAHISPISLSVPYSGIWHLVIDLGGPGGNVRATARIRRYW